MKQARSGGRDAHVKRKVIFAITVFALLLGGACLLSFHRPASLPRIRLPDGGEFRVVQVTYTDFASDASDHAIGSAPKMHFWLWRHLPKALQAKVPYPTTGIGNQGSDHPVLSIWWTYIDPTTHKPQLGATDYVVTTLDSGERLGRIWPDPADDYRQIFITDPPTHSKHLHFQLTAHDHPVEFWIDSPAFRKSVAQGQSRSGESQNSRTFNPVEISVFPEGEWNIGLAVQIPKSLAVRENVEEFEFEYSIVNLFNADVFVAVEPRDDVARSVPGFRGEGIARKLRYSLLPRPNEAAGKRVTYSIDRKAFMSLRNPLESGGSFHLCIYIEGYFRDTGQPFYGSTYVDLPVRIVE